MLNDRTKRRVEVLGKPIEIGGRLRPDFGLQLHQLAQALRVHGLKAVVRVVDDGADAETVRREIVANLARRDDYVLVNYTRKALGQPGGGHISPLGAYDARTDSFLIMDVNPNRAPWVWVRAADLIAAMRTFDTVEKPRLPRQREDLVSDPLEESMNHYEPGTGDSLQHRSRRTEYFVAIPPDSCRRTISENGGSSVISTGVFYNDPDFHPGRSGEIFRPCGESCGP